MIRRLSIFVMLVLTSGAVSRSFGQSGSKAETALNQLMEGNAAQAKITANEVLNSDKNNALAYAVRGNSLTFSADWNGAQADLEKAAKLSPDNGLILAILSDIYYTNKNEAQGKKTLDKAIVALRSPQSAYDYFALGIVHFNMNKVDDAMADYAKAIQLKPNFVRAYAKRGNIYLNKKQDDLALADYSKAISMAPGYTVAYYYRGNILLNKQQYRTAIEDYNTVINQDPAFENAWFNRAVCYKNLGKYDQALADYSKVLQLNPNDWDVYTNRGHVYFMQERWDDAIEEYSTAINKSPKTAISYVWRANSWHKKQNAENCLLDFQKALSIDPKLNQAYIERGMIFYNMKMYDDALLDFKKLVALNPTWGQAYHYMAIAYHDKQDFNNALTNYNKAAELDPSNKQIFFNRADALESIGKTKEANLDRKKFVELGGQMQASGKDTHKSMFPPGSFDSRLAANMLDRGTCTIRGRACTKADGLIFSASGVKVYLYPVTPYLEEWYELREKKEGKKTSVYMSTEANKYRIEASCDYEGRFMFEGLKPGKYFIQVIHSFNQLKTARIYTGQDVQQNGPVRNITNYYYDQDYTVGRSKRLEKFVEIKEEGDTKKITLANGLIKSCVF